MVSTQDTVGLGKEPGGKMKFTVHKLTKYISQGCMLTSCSPYRSSCSNIQNEKEESHSHRASSRLMHHSAPCPLRSCADLVRHMDHVSTEMSVLNHKPWSIHS